MKSNRNILFGYMLLAVLAVTIGGFLGSYSVPELESLQLLPSTTERLEQTAIKRINHNSRFYFSIAPGSYLPAIQEEMRYARTAGLTDFIVQTPLPRSDEERKELGVTLEQLFAGNESDTYWLAVDCNPPMSWLRDHPDEAVLDDSGEAVRPSITSRLWIDNTRSNLNTLLAALESRRTSGVFTGILFEALTDGLWKQGEFRDTTPEFTAHFRRWLQTKYININLLHAVWSDDTLSDWNDITVPADPLEPTNNEVFFDTETQQRQIDYAQFISEETAGVISSIAFTIRTETSDTFSIYASTANVLSGDAADAGTWHIGALRESALTGIASRSPSATFRGRLATPVLPGFSYIYLDASFTGIQYDPASEEIVVPPNYDASILQQSLTRNAALTATHETTWAISDTQGTGTFAHAPLWKDIRELLELRATVQDDSESSPQTPLTLVLDNTSVFAVHDATFVQQIFLTALGTAARSGFPIEWRTVKEILAFESDTPPLYIFLNLFSMNPEGRDSLHAALARQNATAIWLYAPGFIDTLPSIENISLLTGIETLQREPDSKLGSLFAFSGNWIRENQPFSESRIINPSFHTNDETADPLARYQDTLEVSAAMKFHETGWTSIVLYDPFPTPGFIRDLLSILATPTDVAIYPQQGNPLISRFGNTLVMHSDKAAKTRLEFSSPRSARNLLDSTEGWTNRADISVSLQPGETKVLRLD
ncbi:MAG: beta-galactosidase [Candidatus Hydrogenedentota bacterium]